MKEQLIKSGFNEWLQSLDLAPYPTMFWDVPKFIQLSYIQKYLREVHDIHFNFINIMNSNDYEIDIIQQPGHIVTNINNRNTYEKIFEIGLLEALKLIK